MKIIFYGTREYDHYYFDVLAADPEYGCEIRFLTANLDADTAPLAQGGDAVCAFVNADCSAPVLEKLAQVGVRCLLLRCAGYNHVDLAAAKKHGITVLRVPGYSPEAVAEHAMALAQAAMAAVNAVYLIVDTKTGDRYVGSTYGYDGLLGRWSVYVATGGHGNNKGMISHLKSVNHSCHDLQFSVLQVLSKALPDNQIIDAEALWKKKLLTYEPFGMNQN